jgi:hypothetical protein
MLCIRAGRSGRLAPQHIALPVHPPLYCPVPLQELKTKKRYGRLQKAMGDHCLLAGSPLDAQDHYSTGGQSHRPIACCFAVSAAPWCQA